MARGLQWQTVQLSLGGGVETKEDVRAADPRQMDIARDVQFDELKGAQTRKPFAQFGSSVLGAAPLANCRRLATVNGELVLFTDTQVLSWNEAQGVWVPRGTHLAVNVTETPVFSTTGDQVDGDRAELDGTVVYTWTEGAQVFAAAADKLTGSVLVTPITVSTAVGRPRLVALDSRILLFTDAGASNLTVRSIDPSNPGPAIAGAGSTVAAGVFNAFYDVVKVDNQDLAIGVYRRSTTTSYSVFRCTPGLAVTTSTKARTADGPLAVSTTIGAGTQAQIVRANGTNIQGDLLTTSTLADVFTAQAIGTAVSSTINQVTVQYANATTAFAYWTSGSIGETATFTDFTVKSNSVTTANVVGTQAAFRHQLGIAARAFAYGGHAYVWLAFASDSGTSVAGNATAVRAQLQNSYFLYRDDDFVVSRAVNAVGGGFAPSSGRLPGVALTSGSTGFSWCASSHRRIELGAEAEHTGFGSRSPRDVEFAFDSDAARRCAVIGKTLYITGGIPLQYDGVQLAEVGFLVYPWYFEPQVGGPGNLAAGGYTWKSTMRWTNAQGEIDRSTTATGMTLTVPASKFVFLNFINIYVTLKLAPRPPTQDMWRTAADIDGDPPFYLVTSQDPNAGIVSNGYVVNSDTAVGGAPLPDNFVDATLTTKEPSPENGGALEYLAPPCSSIIIATDTRVLLAGVAGDPDAVWYSRLRGSGQVASFHDGNVIAVPRDGGDITALAYLNETLVVFRETAVYAVPGQGFDNLGQGQNFGPTNRLSSDVGAVSAEAVVLTPMGLVFKSRKGWYLLDRGWGVKYIGAAVAAFDGDTVHAAHVVETQHQVRILTSGRLLVWDYYNTTESAPMGQWAEWTITDGIHAVIWNGSYVYLTATGPMIEQAAYSGLTYGADIESSWIKLADLQGAARVRWIEVLGEFRSPFLMRIRVAKNYEYDGAGNVVYFDDKAWPATPETIGSALQVRHSPSQGQLEAIKVRLTAVAAGVAAVFDGDGFQPNPIFTLAAMWDAVFRAVPVGEMGNAVTMSITFEDGAPPFIVDVRDHLTYDLALGRWRERYNNVGVRVVCRVGSSPTSAELEAAIAAGTALVTLVTPDANPSSPIDAAAMADVTATATTSGGTYVAPTGEACKLTGLGLEVGVKPGLFRRLPAENKQ